MALHGGFDPNTRIVLVGAGGMLGNMVAATAPPDIEIVEYDLPQMDIADISSVSTCLHQARPDYIINCAALTDVDGCESQKEQALAVNAEGPGHLATIAAEIGATLLHISTDFVFAGATETPYTETDIPEPLSVYGHSKHQGEMRVETSGLERYFILRTSWLYGPWGKNFVETIIRLAQERDVLKIVSDQVGTPTYSRDLAKAIWTLLDTDLYGTYHYSNEGQCSWYEFTAEIVRLLRQLEGDDCLRVGSVEPIPGSEFPQAATRPPWSVMSKQKIKNKTGIYVPQWQESLARYLHERQHLSGN